MPPPWTHTPSGAFLLWPDTRQVILISFSSNGFYRTSARLSGTCPTVVASCSPPNFPDAENARFLSLIVLCWHMNGSKSTNHNPRTWPFEPMKVNFCWLHLFPETSAKMIDIWSRFHVACSSRLSLVKIWRTFAYVEGQQNINVYDVRQPFVSCVLPKFRILKMSQNISPWVRLEFVTNATIPPEPAVALRPMMNQC